jgi:hypothetical protein
VSGPYMRAQAESMHTSLESNPTGRGSCSIGGGVCGRKGGAHSTAASPTVHSASTHGHTHIHPHPPTHIRTILTTYNPQVTSRWSGALVDWVGVPAVRCAAEREIARGGEGGEWTVHASPGREQAHIARIESHREG